MFLCNSYLQLNEKVPSKHPWEGTIRPELANKIKYAHNSVHNVKYPAPKKNNPHKDMIKYTIIGNRITKEFIYCSNIVKGLHKYRPQNFEAPAIRGVTSVEWSDILHKLQVQYGGLAFCLQSQVAVIANGKFLGGEKELCENIREKYYYNISLDYCKKAKENFVNFIRSSGRPCVYMHISIDDEHIGTLLFMLYSDIVPATCENFLRLCQRTKGGYPGTPVHRIVKDCWIQCGGFGLKSTSLDCENYIVPPDRRGVICMANDGRNVDCSTQFFVLLQPALWMAYKYVAFGQLIESAETLQKIESIPTWYESPTSKIIIYRAGILNLESQDIKINKGTKEYLEGHIENLVVLGELLYAELIKNVFKVISEKISSEMKSAPLPDYEYQMEEMEYNIPHEYIEEDRGENIHLRETKRFIRKKEDIEKIPSTPSDASDISWDNKNFEGGFEVSEDVPEEEQAYQHISLSGDLDVKPVIPYYIPFTDVPYPGEANSTFNLIKFLKGDYCLENELETFETIKYIRPKFSFYSEMYFEQRSNGSSHAMSLDSEDELEIKKFLKVTADRVSFAGSIIKNIAKSSRGPGMHNIFENVTRSDLVTDDDQTKFRKVHLRVPDVQERPHKILRRPTGYIHEDVIEKLRMRSLSCCSDDLDLDKSDSKILRQQSTSSQKIESSSSNSSDISESNYQRPSPFAHLFKYSETIPEETPTFKNQIQKTDASKTILLKRAKPRLESNENNIQDNFMKPSIQSCEHMLNLRHGKQAAHKISSDYVKTIDQIEKRCHRSIRSIEFEKTRPSMTVSKYQMKNQKYYEEMKKAAK